MRRFTKGILTIAMAGAIALPSIVLAQKEEPAVQAATPYGTTTPTGYDSADDVQYVYVTADSEKNYVKDGKYVANWGARGEDCVFLSSKATEFYTGSNTYENFSVKEGGTYSEAYKSTLFKALNTFVKEEQTHITTYGDIRYEFQYTDCVSNDTSKISSFYLGELYNSTWNGSTYNREHTWPKSKCINDESEKDDSADMHMIRPTNNTENSKRSNTAYGESSGYYDPNKNGWNIRGDCARIILYTYVRWNNPDKLWGENGVMESLSVMLRWMEEDPVDTWEMGRNDAIEAITGTRNVFIDYPELAWLLFNEDVPNTMVTPSGIAKSAQNKPSNSGNGSSSEESDDSSSVDSSSSASSNSSSSSSGSVSSSDTHSTSAPTSDSATCQHVCEKWYPTDAGMREGRCTLCGEWVEEEIPTSEDDLVQEPTVDNGGCAASLYGTAATVLAAMACAVVLRKKYN